MLRYADDINRTIRGLGAVVENQAPAIRLLVRNWPITAIAGIAVGTRMMQRYKKKELSTYNVFVDLGMILAPVVAFLTLQKLGTDQEAAKASANASAPGLTPLPTPPQLIQ